MEIKGVLEKTVDIPARGSETISIQTDIKEVKMFKTGWDFIIDKKDTRYKSTFSCKLISDNNALNNSNMNMTIEGTLDEIINAAGKLSSK